MINELNKKNFEDSIIYYMLIALFCMNFLGRGSFFCLIFAIFSMIKLSQKLILDSCSFITLFLSLSVLFLSMVKGDVGESAKSLNYFLMYIIGLNGYCASINKQNYVNRSLFSIYAGYTFIIALTFLGNLNEARVFGQRTIKNIWTGEYIAVTLIGLLSAVVIGYFFYALFCQKSKFIKLLNLFSIVIVFFVNAQTATRTPIILFSLIMVLMTGIYLINQRGIKALKFVVIIIFVVIIAVLLIVFDIGGIRTYFESTPLFARFQSEGAETSRIDIAKSHLKYMFDYPFGGGNIQNIIGYAAHNFIQQGYDLYGAISGILLICIFISFVRNIFRLIKINKKEDADYLLISLYLSMITQSFLEPVFTGYPCFIFTLLLIHGIATGYLNSRATYF